MANLLVVFHLVAVLQFVYSLYYNVFHVNVNMPREGPLSGFHLWGGSLKYLTVWNVILQSVFFWICLVNDLIGSNEINPKPKPLIRGVKDFIHTTLGFPLAAFVAITFWGLYAIDRELIFPKAIDPYFPGWLNHVMHTNILIFTLVELIYSFRAYPSRKKGISFLAVFMLTYLIWTFVIFAKTGHWVYPVMEVLNWPQRIAFFLVLLGFVLGLYLVGETLNKLLWRQQLKSVESSSKKQPRKKTK